MTNSDVANLVDPTKLKAIARAVLGLVAVFVPQATWTKLLLAFLDALTIEAKQNAAIANALVDLPRPPYGVLSAEVRDAYNV